MTSVYGTGSVNPWMDVSGFADDPEVAAYIASLPRHPAGKSNVPLEAVLSTYRNGGVQVTVQAGRKVKAILKGRK
jgi:hypothetical protein